VLSNNITPLLGFRDQLCTQHYKVLLGGKTMASAIRTPPVIAQHLAGLFRAGRRAY